MKFNQLIQELNLYSADPLTLSLKNIVSSRTDDPAILNWFTTKYVRWFKSGENDDQKAVWTRKHDKQEGEPSWVDNAFDFVGFDRDEEEKIAHWVDYFLSLSDLEKKKIDKLTYSDVSARVAEWDEEMKKGAGRGTARGDVETKVNKYKSNNKEGTLDLVYGEDFKIFQRTSNPKYVWVRHLSQQSLECESDDLGHCVGRGGYNVDRNPIISLWDRKGNSYVTIEMDENMEDIKQIKGKANSRPHEKYIPFIKDFVTENKFNVTNDGEALGMVRFENKYYWPDTAEWDDVYQNKIIPLQQQKFEEIKRRIVYPTD